MVKQEEIRFIGPVEEVFITEPAGLTSQRGRVKLAIKPNDFAIDEALIPTVVSSQSGEPYLDTLVSEPNPNTPEPYLIVGFDTEFKTPAAVTLQDVREGGIKYQVLSYQFRAATSNGIEWEGLCLPEKDERITLGAFLLFVLATGARRYGLSQLPRKIYLVGHFVRADLPAFLDFKEFIHDFMGVRGTFASGNRPIKLSLKPADTDLTFVDLSVYLADTMLLTPQSSKSLKSLGELVDVPKVELDADSRKRKWMIENMDRVRSENWELFRRYALTDAVICVKYLQRIIHQYFKATGKFKVPLTLSAVAVDVLLEQWSKDGVNRYNLLGKEQVNIKLFDKSKNKSTYKWTSVKKELLHINEALITECYHGGRNEQFWFGPGFTDTWNDFDLSGAYPTAMSMIAEPDWDHMYSSTDPKDYTADKLGFALVEFEFPESVRYPTLVVRSEGSLVFPRKGRAYCSAPEIFLARRLKANLKIVNGVIIPSSNIQIFSNFLQVCTKNRYAAGKHSLEGLMWKEISNSMYGKSAQGLRKRRIYDIADGEMKDLPQSKITNAVFAAYTTSFTRAVLGEVMNAIPENRLVFSVTTDGFITNTTDDEIIKCLEGPLAKGFGLLREKLVDKIEILETKHVIKRPLGWRTRGQATLEQGAVTTPDLKTTILAKAGIHTRPELDTIESQNDEIVRLFRERNPDSYITVQSLSGMRDMLENDVDLVPFTLDRRLNMEYDYKQRPSGIVMSKDYEHIAFTTQPWNSIEEYELTRRIWQTYNKKTIHCIKTEDDFQKWAKFLAEQSTLDGTEKGKYVRKENGQLQKLRQSLCAAFKADEPSLTLGKNRVTNEEFAAFLNDVGIKCTKANVENGKKQIFEPNACLRTDEVVDALQKLKRYYKKLDINLFLYDPPETANTIDLTKLGTNQFLAKVT